MAHRVLQLTGSNGFYGAERVVIELALHLRDQGWDCRVGALIHPGGVGEEMAEEARGQGLETVTFPCKGAFDLSTMRAIRSYVRDQRIDLLHSHKYKTDVYSVLARLPLATRKVCTCHLWTRADLRQRLYELLDKLSLHLMDHVVAVSAPLYEELRRVRIPPARRSLIENGMSFQPGGPDARAAMRAELGVAEHEALLLRICRLAPEKGLDTLLRAMAKLGPESRTRLLLAGDGELLDELREQARSLGLADQVIFAGYRKDVPALMAASDLFVISSSAEGLPMVLLEAMAARLPVVTTPAGSIPKVIEDRVNGLLVPVGDATKLAAAIELALREPDQARQWAQRAFHTFERNHSRKAMGDAYLAVYRRVLGRA